MPLDHGDLISKLGKAATVATALELPKVNVRAWELRGKIPPEHWPAVIRLANLGGYAVTADWMMRKTPARKAIARPDTPSEPTQAEAA